MKLRSLALALAAAGAAACAPKLEFSRYQDPSGAFSAELPGSWAREGDPDLGRKPVAVVSFVGKVVAQDEGIPLGAVINVTRICRRRADVPGDEATFKKFAQGWLLRSDALFGGPADGFTETQKAWLALPRRDALVGGLPAKVHRQDYEQTNPLHMDKPVAMRLEDAVVRTPEAYYVLELRATRELFDRYYPAFARLLATAAFAKSAG